MVFGKDPTNDLYDTTMKAEIEYYKRFTEKGRKFCLRFHYNRVNIYIFSSGAEIQEFNMKYFETNAAPLFLGKVSKYFHLITWKILDNTDVSKIFHSIMVVLMLLIIWIFINI